MIEKIEGLCAKLDSPCISEKSYGGIFVERKIPGCKARLSQRISAYISDCPNRLEGEHVGVEPLLHAMCDDSLWVVDDRVVGNAAARIGWAGGNSSGNSG